LREVGTPSTRPSAQYPFWRLQGDGLWEVEAPVALAPRRSNTDPKVTELRRDGVRGGFPESADRTLRTDPEFVSRVARTVLDEHFPTSLHPDILTKVGLDVGVAERPVEPYAGRARRDPGFAPGVLRAYEYRCAVCAYDGQVGKISVGIEAAHVKWFSHGGPDVVENGLSLCSLHHRAFDLGAIAISDDHIDLRHPEETSAPSSVSTAPLAIYAAYVRSGAQAVPGYQSGAVSRNGAPIFRFTFRGIEHGIGPTVDRSACRRAPDERGKRG
jgi:putative restriction endonuclease